eukprot:11368674-Alexandrium_andersonii.AAC.1
MERAKSEARDANGRGAREPSAPRAAESAEASRPRRMGAPVHRRAARVTVGPPGPRRRVRPSPIGGSRTRPR